MEIKKQSKKRKKVISEIQIVPVKPRDGLVAFCSFILFEGLYCKSVAIYTKPNGTYRLVYPMKNRINLFHPITKSLGETIEEAVSNKLFQLQNISSWDLVTELLENDDERDRGLKWN